MEVEISRKDLKILSHDFRVIASRLITTNYDEGLSNLQRFVSFIKSNPIINDFIEKNQVKQFDIKSIYEQRGYNDSYPIPELKEEEIAFTYQLIIFALENVKDYYRLAFGYSHGRKIQDAVDEFNRRVIFPFVQHINSYFERLLIEMGEDEKTSVQINISGGNVGQFNLGQDNSIINATNVNNYGDIQKFNELVDKFLLLIDKEDISKDDKEEVVDLVSTAKEGVNSGKPKKGLLKTCLEKLNGLFSKIKEGNEFAKTLKDLITTVALIIQSINSGS